MADVNVTVAVDGKAVFSAGATGTPDGCGAVVAMLQLALAHFQAIKLAASSPPSPQPVTGTQQPKDNSL